MTFSESVDRVQTFQLACFTETHPVIFGWNEACVFTDMGDTSIILPTRFFFSPNSSGPILVFAFLNFHDSIGRVKRLFSGVGLANFSFGAALK